MVRRPPGPRGPPTVGPTPPPTGLALAALALRKCGGTYDDFVAGAGAGSGVSSLGTGSEMKKTHYFNKIEMHKHLKKSMCSLLKRDIK